MIFNNPKSPNALSRSALSKKLLYNGLNMVKQAFPAPIRINAIRKYGTVFVVKNIPRLAANMIKLATIIFRFPYRSARIPHGMDRMVQERLLYINMLPRLWALNPRATR